MTRLRTLAAAALASATLLVPAAASAARPAPLVLDGLGDSYASGYGVPPYSSCGRSDAAPAVMVDGRRRLQLDDFVACAGATSASLIAGGQLDALDADTDVVTLSVGGNDIGWGNVVAACLGGSDAQCAGALAATRTRVTTQLPGMLEPVYDGIDAAAPDAQVIVTGYPHLFTPEAGAMLGASPAEQAALNEGADLLNATIRATAQAHGYTFADVTRKFDGHGANSADPWLLGPFDQAAFHPNARGYEAYAAAVTSAVRAR